MFRTSASTTKSTTRLTNAPCNSIDHEMKLM
jgi:hypothetical protein